MRRATPSPRALVRLAAPLLFLAAGAASAPLARADYAVLKSGMRLHITGYQASGDQLVLNVDGGTLTIAASDLVSVEPEERFSPIPVPPAAPAGPYANLIRAAAEKNHLDEKLVTRLIKTESNFNPRAVSRKQARGLMQLMPDTAARLAVRDVFDPAQNIDAGTKYLRQLLDKYKGDIRLALAAYNAGPEIVEKYGGVPPFAETENYVRTILAALRSSDGT